MPKIKSSSLTNSMVNKEMKELETKNKMIDIEKFFVNRTIRKRRTISRIKEK